MQHLQPNTTLQGGKYRIERVLGQGGFGITYLAKYTSNGRKVAIKELFVAPAGQAINSREGNEVVVTNASNQEEFEKHKSKFKKEADRLSKFKHRNLVKVSDYFEENGTVYYVMQYIEGESLRSKLNREGALSESLVLDYLRQLLTALEVIHREKIWHLDIKPDNIMVEGNDNIFLIDFGASKHIVQSGTLTTSSMMLLTHGYYPPEQISSNIRDIGAWTDIYALGATIYNLLTRKEPPSFDSIVCEGRNAFSFTSNVSPNMRNLIVNMMNPNRKERLQNVSEVRRFQDKTEEKVDLTIVESTRKKETKLTSSSETSDDETIVGKPVAKPESKPIPTHKPQAPKPTVTSDNKDDNSAAKLLWIIILLVVGIVLIFAGINNCGGTSETIDTPEYIGIDNIVKQEEKRVVDWSGEYSAVKDAGGTYGGTPVFWETTFSLKRVNDTEYEGSMSISGYQTSYEPAKIRGYADGNRIRIYFVSCDDDEYGLNKWSDICEYDTPLLSLAIENGAIDSEWYAALVETECVDQSTPVKKQK